MLAVLSAVICITTITFSIDAIGKRITTISNTLLGGDRVITASEKFSPALIEQIQNDKLNYSQVITFYSMLSTDNEFLLTSVKAVANNYPLLGELKASQELNTPGITMHQPPEPGTLWLESRAVIQLQVNIGDKIHVGDAELKLTAILTSEPDRAADGFTFAPRALINIIDIDKTRAIAPGSRVDYKILMTGQQYNLNSFDVKFKKEFPQYKLLNSQTNSSSSSIKSLNLATKYLNLALLINIILAAITVFICANHYTTRHFVDAAVLRCLGASKLQVMIIYGGNLFHISLILGIAGTCIGFILQMIIAKILYHYFNFSLAIPGWWPALIGIFCALILTLLFAMPSIMSLTKTSPVNALQRASLDSKNIEWRLHFRFSNKLPTFFRLALNNLCYNSQSNFLLLLVFIVVICGGMILLVVKNDLINSWQQQLPQNIPNYFAINIPPEKISIFTKILDTNKIQASELYPIIRGNLTKINGQEVSETNMDDKRTGINRPLNLTWTANLPNGNNIIEGKWFDSNDYGIPVASVENEIAQRLNVKIGDELTFKIMQQEISAKINSIRTVNWSSFTPNFYLIYNPGIIHDLPITYMSSFYLSAEQNHLLIELIRNFPEINLININAMIDQAKSVIAILSIAVSFIWFFTIAIAILLFIAIMTINLNLRIYQNNLMRVFGASKKQLYKIFIYEFSILGSIAGGIGSIIAIIIAKQISWQYFSLYYPLNWILVFYGIVLGVIIMLITGLFGSNNAFNKAPTQIIKNLN